MSENQIAINEVTSITNQETYDAVRGYVVAAQKQVNTAVNSAMVTAYWNIGIITLQPYVNMLSYRKKKQAGNHERFVKLL